jgi:hypothetical protein
MPMPSASSGSEVSCVTPIRIARLKLKRASRKPFSYKGNLEIDGDVYGAKGAAAVQLYSPVSSDVAARR